MTEWIIAALSKIFSFAGLKVLLTTIVVYIEYAIGWFDLVMKWLLMLMMLDFAMGFANAWKHHRVSRTKMRDGIYKFILYAILIGTGHWTDIVVFHQEVEFGFQNAFIVYLGLTEAISILKHGADLWAPVPKRILIRLESYRDKIDVPDGHIHQ